MIIDFEFIMNKYKIDINTILKILSSPNFEKHINIIDQSFDLNFFNKTYNKNYLTFDEAYTFWMNNRKYGYKGCLKKEHNITYYSQLNQDYIIINELFKKTTGGTFVEFGGCDGLFLSNTLTLEKYFGWNGLLIEPCDEYFNKLINNRKCKCINEVIYSEVKDIEFGYSTNLELSGIKSKLNTDVVLDKSLIRTTKTLETILDENNMPKVIHYMSVDIEGGEYDALVNFPFNTKYKVYALSIEHANNAEYEKKIKDLMESKNYILYKNQLWDNIYILPELLEKKVVNSFDIFDTLIHRYYYSDMSIINMMVNKINEPDFLQKRKILEDSTISLEDIYDKMGKKDMYSVEFELEKKYLFLNYSNYKELKANDILISDIYYSQSELNEILSKFNINNTLYFSKAGKRSGSMYEKLLNDYIIVSHTGDNLHSDGIMAKKFNINSYTHDFGKFEELEKLCLNNNLKNITLLLRKTRLSLPYVSDLISTMELTLLINLIIYQIIKNYIKNKDYNNILLSLRDCCHLYKIFNVLSDINHHKLYSSRVLYKNPSMYYLEYFNNIIKDNRNLLIDMNGTGESVINFTNKNKITNVDILYINKFKNLPINCIFDNIKEIIDVLEIINYDINGKCVDYCGGPIYNPIEYDTTNLNKIHAFVNYSVNIISLDENIKNDISKELESINPNNLIEFCKFLILLFKKSEYFKNIQHIC